MSITRRTFLATAAASYAWSRTWPVAAAAEIDEFSFVIVSDTHLGRNDSDSAERQWRAAIDEINQGPGEFVLHLGDVVDGGRPAHYPRYAELRKSLTKPIHEIPGNHDPRELFEQHICRTIDRSFDHRGVRFLLFNNSRTDSHLGFITPAQLTWLDEQCSAAASHGLKIVAACHVPVHKNQHPDRGWYVQPAEGATGFYDLVTRHAERFLACFHGHFHNGIRGWRDRGELVEVLCPSVCYNQNRNLADAIKNAQTTGFYVDELRAGYVLATLGRGRLTMRYKPLGQDVHGEYQAEWKA